MTDPLPPGTRVAYPVAPGDPRTVTGTVVGVTGEGDPLVRSDSPGGVVVVEAGVCSRLVPVVAPDGTRGELAIPPGAEAVERPDAIVVYFPPEGK